jgi:hypothetical protein
LACLLPSHHRLLPLPVRPRPDPVRTSTGGLAVLAALLDRKRQPCAASFISRSHSSSMRPVRFTALLMQ